MEKLTLVISLVKISKLSLC